MIFKDRKQAGAALASQLSKYQQDKNAVVLGLPRGGVAVAEEVAKSLQVPLDVMLMRKLPHPAQPELAVGAVAENGAVFVNEEFLELTREDPSWLKKIIQEQMNLIRHRQFLYRSHRRPQDLRGKTVILVDDGIATGATMKVAVRSARAAGASRIVVAVPVASPSSLVELEAEADEVTCLEAPEDFYAVGQVYASFEQVSDGEVCAILDRNP